MPPTPAPGRPPRGPRTGRPPGRRGRARRPAPPLLVAFDLLGRRWALRVLWELRAERLGFRALRERCDGMSSSGLRARPPAPAQARILDTDDEGRYGLTRDGRGLLEALEPLSRWAERWGRRRSRSEGGGAGPNPQPP